MQHPVVYVVLLNYNGWKDTQECLESILKLDYLSFKIIVVDNNSPNDSMAHLLAWAGGDEQAEVGNVVLSHLSLPLNPKPVEYILYDKETALRGGDLAQESQCKNPIIFIQSGENRGFAAGNNVGIEYALKKGDADYIWCLNNDTVVESNALSEYVNKADFYKKKNKKVGIIGAKLMYYHQPELIQAVGGRYNKWFATTNHIGVFERDIAQYDSEQVTQQIDYPIGASMFVDVAFVKDVGLMCEDYFLYFEELDWVSRGFAKGWSAGYCWSARVFHKEGASIGSSTNVSQKSDFSDFYGLVNRIRFTRKFFPSKEWSVRSFFMITGVRRLLRKKFKQAKLAFCLAFWGG